MRSKKKRGAARKEPKVSMWMLAYTLEARLAVEVAYAAEANSPSTISEFTDVLFNTAMDQQKFKDGQGISWFGIPGLNGKEEIFTMQIMERPTRNSPGLIGCFLAPMERTETYCQCDVCKATRAKQAA